MEHLTNHVLPTTLFAIDNIQERKTSKKTKDYKISYDDYDEDGNYVGPESESESESDEELTTNNIQAETNHEQFSK